MCRGSRCLSGLSLRRGWGAGVSSPDFGHAWAWTWQLLLPPGDTPAHFSTLVPNNKGLKVDCWGSTKDKIVLGRRGSWLLLPAVGSPSAHVAGGAGTPAPVHLAACSRGERSKSADALAQVASHPPEGKPVGRRASVHFRVQETRSTGKIRGRETYLLRCAALTLGPA